MATEAVKSVAAGFTGVVLTGGREIVKLLRGKLGEPLPEDAGKLQEAIVAAAARDPQFAVQLSVALAALTSTVGVSGPPPPVPYFNRQSVRDALAVPGVHLIAGMHGMGKTALVLQVARDVAEQFPDGCAYVDLDDHRVGEALPADAVQAAVLGKLGVSSIEETPALVNDQYLRALMHRHCVLILENVLDADELTRLAHPWPTNLVLVTTRRLTDHLRDWSPTPPVSLQGLDRQGAWEMLDGRCPGMLAAEKGPALALLELCNWSPFAITQVAVRLQRRNGVPGGVAAVYRELVTSKDRGELIEQCLSKTVSELPDATVEDLITLAAQPVHDLSYDAVAAMLGRGVDRLIDDQLVFDDGKPGRLRLPALIRDHARQIRQDRPVDADMSFVRLLRFLRDRTVAADLEGGGRFRIYRRPAGLNWDPSWPAPLNWLEAELPVIGAVIPQAFHTGRYEEVTQLCGGLERLLTARGHHQQILAANEWGIRAARALANPALESRIHAVQARVLTQLGQFDQAEAELAEAERLLPLVDEGLLAALDKARLESATLEVRARLAETRGDLDHAEQSFRSCLAIDERWQLQRGAGIHYRMLANVLVRQGRAAEALPLLTAASDFNGKDKPTIERRRNAARIHTVTARAHLALGNVTRARIALDRARELSTQATAVQYDVELADLEGELALRSGAPETARLHWGWITDRYFRDGRDSRFRHFLRKLILLPPPV